MAEFEIQSLGKKHDRSGFRCGHVDLDLWLRQYATQNEKLRLTKTYVAVRPGDRVVLGYHAIRAGEVSTQHVPQRLAKRLPKYPIPVLHLARLAVSIDFQGHGIGELLLMHCLAKAIDLSMELGLHAVEVVAITESARRFYFKYGFVSMNDDVNHLYLAVKTAREAFSKS